MEFTYKISEQDYLLAASIVVKPPKWGAPLWTRYALPIWLLGFMILATAVGIYSGSESAGLPHAGSLGARIVQPLLEAIVPASLLTWLYSITGHLFLKVVRKKRERALHLANYRANPACQHESTVTLTSEIVRFQCGPNCFTQSPWSGYLEWIEKGNILLLITTGRQRRILQVGSLSNTERQELREILSSALSPKGGSS